MQVNFIFFTGVALKTEKLIFILKKKKFHQVSLSNCNHTSLHSLLLPDLQPCCLCPEL